MSEQQNTAVVRKNYDAFAKGDVQTVLNSLTEDVEWIYEGPEIIPFAGKRKGIAQVRQFFEALATSQVNTKLTVDNFVAQGDLVATLGRVSGKVKATGKSTDVPFAHFATLRNGKVCRFVSLTDTAAVADAFRATSAAAR